MPASTSSRRASERRSAALPDCDIFLDDVTVSARHAVLLHKATRFFHRKQGSLNGTFLNRRRIESGRLENGDELQIGKYKLTRNEHGRGDNRTCQAADDRRCLDPPAGATPRHLDFEEPLPRSQGLLAPRRTQSGYRAQRGRRRRVETILRLQRDDSAAGDPTGARLAVRRRQGAARAVVAPIPTTSWSWASSCDRARWRPSLRGELEEYGLLQPRRDGGEKLYPAGDVDVAVACSKLTPARVVSARHLRTFRAAGANREAGLLEQLVAPSLRSRNPERRDAAVQQLQTLAEVAQESSRAPLLAQPAAGREPLMKLDDLKAHRSATSRTSPSPGSSSRTSCRFPTRPRCTR